MLVDLTLNSLGVLRKKGVAGRCLIRVISTGPQTSVDSIGKSIDTSAVKPPSLPALLHNEPYRQTTHVAGLLCQFLLWNRSSSDTLANKVCWEAIVS